MRWWDERVVPRLTDLSLRGHEVGEWRADICAGLTGRVVELGFGSGLNARWYPEAVTEVHAVEPSDRGWELSARRRARSTVRIERTGLDGQRLTEADDSADHVLTTFTLCTIPDVSSALREVRRVLKPGGSVRFVEHGLSPDDDVRRWQHRLDGLQQRVAGGCHLTRDMPALLSDAGFEITVERQGYLDGPTLGRAWTWLTAGRAY